MTNLKWHWQTKTTINVWHLQAGFIEASPVLLQQANQANFKMHVGDVADFIFNQKTEEYFIFFKNELIAQYIKN